VAGIRFLLVRRGGDLGRIVAPRHRDRSRCFGRVGWFAAEAIHRSTLSLDRRVGHPASPEFWSARSLAGLEECEILSLHV